VKGEKEKNKEEMYGRRKMEAMRQNNENEGNK
jgi:hypothetical protein